MTSFLDEILPRPTLAEGEIATSAQSPEDQTEVSPTSLAGASVDRPADSPSASVELISDFEKHTLPSGAVVFFRGRDHAYFRQIKLKSGGTYSGSDRISGASTATKPIDFQADALLRWAAKANGEGISMLAREAMTLDPEEWPLALSFLESEETIWQELTTRKLTYDDLRQQRAREGTKVHEQVLHALATHEPVPPLDEFTEKEQGYARAILSWWNERHPLPLQSEQVVYSANYGFAGRFDLRARISDLTTLVDLKTSGFISMAMHVQLRAYEEAAIESGIGESDQQMILQVRDDGTWTEHCCQATEQHLLNVLAVYRDASELGKLVRAEVTNAEGRK